MTDNQKADTIRQLMVAIVETVIETDDVDGIGTPGGILFSALMTIGMSYDSFSRFMTGLVNSGAIKQNGNCYHATELGREFVRAAKRVEARQAAN